MAVKKPPVLQATPAAIQAVEGADDLEILHPERRATIAGRVVVVREYGFVEGMRLRPVLQVFLDDLHACVVEDGQLPSLERIQAIIGVHIDVISEAVATAADVELEWVHRLNQDDGQHLLMLWWAANGPFYVRSVYQRVAAERIVESQPAGGTSTPSSSHQGTDPQQTSAD